MVLPKDEIERPSAIGPYTILGEIGRGGMGVVYRAADARLGREVALKVLPRRIARDPERVQRFQLEARIVATVDHPGIATVYSLEESDGRHFLTMELVPGQTLADLIDGGPLPVADALGIGQQIASALEAAHRQGVVHRDLKPANVMVSEGLRTKVLDFGLAKVEAPDGSAAGDQPTASGSLGPIFGTPGYASPEQLRGEDVDARTDVFAFGALLYEAISGRPAFPGDTPADRIAASLQRPPDWDALGVMPERLRRLIVRCLERTRGGRVDSMAQVRSEIDAIVAGRPSSDSTAPPPAAPVDTPHNLPLPLASFVGRGRERRAAVRALRASRLVTLTGTGGGGKTRLALEVARSLLADHPDGVWFASFASVGDASQVLPTVTNALGLQEEPKLPLTETLLRHLDGRRCLLVLDNCEHLLADCARLVDRLLAQAGDVRILATSREALGLPGEQVFHVPPLPVPDSAEDRAAETLRGVDSVRLFVERAAAVTGFVLTDDNAAAVSRICRRLDGIPLAIELAASRLRALPAEEIARRLDNRFHLLSGGPAATEERHRTLRALIDWSHDLLSADEQTLFRRLAVFAGGWNLAAAEAICAGQGIAPRAVLGLLSRLVERSLVEVQGPGRGAAGPRYTMLETIRAFARDHLRASDDGDATRRRHRNWFGRVAEEAHVGLTGPDQTAWVARLEEDHGNLRSAIETCARSDVHAGLAMVGALGRYWYARGRWTEGRGLLLDFLGRPEAAGRTAERARALNWTGWLMYWQGDFEEASAVVGEALAIAREHENPLGVAEALNNLGAVEMALGHAEAARAYHEDALAIRRKAGDRRAIAVSVHNLGELYLSQGDYEQAREALEESLALFREVGHAMGANDSLGALGEIAEQTGDLEKARACHEECLATRRERNEPVGTSSSLRHLGRLAAKRGEYARAHALLAESATILHELGDRMDLAVSLEALAELAAQLGRPARAVRILGAADSLRERTRAPAFAADRERLERTVALAREVLGADAFDAEWHAGRSLRRERAVRIAIAAEEDPVVSDGGRPA